MSVREHLFISDLREPPRDEVCLVVDGKLVSGTNALGVTASIDEMIREAKEQAWNEGWNDGAGWPQSDTNPYKQETAP